MSDTSLKTLDGSEIVDGSDLESEGNSLMERPSYAVSGERAAGVELLSEFVIPPRLKLVQPQSDADLKAQFSEGTLLLSPQGVEIPTPFSFTPIFFYPEWITWNPRGMSHLPVINYRTQDPNDPLVPKTRDPNRWSEPHPDAPGNPKMNLRHCEHLNFVMIIHGIPGMENMPVVQSFSRSEHPVGQSFITLLKMRDADIFACNFDAIVSHRKNSDGNWFGLDIRNPAECPPWVSADKIEYFRTLHNEYREAHAKRQLQTDYSDGEGTVSGKVIDPEVAAEM